jgi:hypothetical protein
MENRRIVSRPILKPHGTKEITVDKKQETAALVMADLGPVSKVTLGIPYITPWLEGAPPPFQYWCRC